MTAQERRATLAAEPPFQLGSLEVTPSSCRVSRATTEIRVEAQTMAVLVVLAKAGERTVTREDLIESCWQGRIVTDDAINRTIAKVRALARSFSPEAFTLETLPKVGYRLVATPVSELAPNSEAGIEHHISPPQKRLSKNPRAVLVAVLLTAISGLLFIWIFTGKAQPAQGVVLAATITDSAPRLPEISDALFSLDAVRLKSYLDKGWNPAWLLDSENNTALHNLMLACERNPSHDRAGVLKVARLLVEAGADTRTRNKWGDTPLMVAESSRYCGHNHPVTLYLRTLPGAGGG